MYHVCLIDIVARTAVTIHCSEYYYYSYSYAEDDSKVKERRRRSAGRRARPLHRGVRQARPVGSKRETEGVVMGFVSRHRGRTGTALLLLLAALVVALALSAPALAKVSTTLTVTAQSTSVNWSSTAILNGILQTTSASPLPVDGEQVLVQYATSADAVLWTTAATVTNAAAPYSSGQYTYSWKAARNYYWRMRYEGSSQYEGITGNVVYVKVKPVIGKPSCPSKIKAKKKFTVSGSLKPRYAPGSKTVKVNIQISSNHKWKAYKTYKATNANSGSYSKYSVKISISKKGKYRFYGTTANTSTLAAGKSAYSRTLTVK
jgi:hypothetical protein